jgi:hypothetical protein
MQRSDLVPIVTRLLRNTPGPELQAYFAQRSVEFPEPVDWNNGAGALLVPVRNAINALNEIDGARIRLDAEQVDRMTSEVGQTALMDVVTAEQRRLLCGKATRHGRALWLFLNDPQRFKRAEEASFFENARRGRTWDGFVARAGLEVSRETGHLQALASEIQRFFREGEKVNIEVFDRVRAQDGEVEGLVQVTVLREGFSTVSSLSTVRSRAPWSTSQPTSWRSPMSRPVA